MTDNLDLQTTYSAILAAARERRFINYGALAEANGAYWPNVRHKMNTHLDNLVQVTAESGWPLPSAIVVNKKNLMTGKLDGVPRDGFIKAAKKYDFNVNDPTVFVAKQQEAVFEWATNAPDSLDLPDNYRATEITTAGPKYVQFFGPVLDSLRDLGGSAKISQVIKKVVDFADVTKEELKETNKNDRSKYENKVRWAGFYLAKAELLDNKKRGIWTLTREGLETYLDHEDAVAIFKNVYAQYSDTTTDDEEVAPEISQDTNSELFDDPDRRFWFAGAFWEAGDQTEIFLQEGIWKNGYDDRFGQDVARMQPGDRIAIKAACVKKKKDGLPFINHGKPVSCMYIKAIGTITEATKDGQTVKVDWTKLAKRKEWYFYTYRTTLVEADASDSLARRLIQFAFGNIKQDIDFFLRKPYWAKKYRKAAETITDLQLDEEEAEADIEETTFKPYKISNIIGDGCFLPEANLKDALAQLSEKKNLILQGPPGTGKTWLAKRLAYAHIGTSDRKLTQKRTRVIQFHPSLSYEDFVRGWRPDGNGQLKLTDGVFLEAVEAAQAERDRPFVVIIEEINRGNPAQIFGEMLTLLEKDKRNEGEAIELAYRNEAGERVYIPDNLYVIGTMNIADRSLALVDLAFRRRFAFVTLETMLNESWIKWCEKQAGWERGIITKIRDLMNELNEDIASDRSLGAQFRIGHSYITPAPDKEIKDPAEWFSQVVETEIGPLLAEYWFDNPEKAVSSTKKLLEGW